MRGNLQIKQRLTRKRLLVLRGFGGSGRLLMNTVLSPSRGRTKNLRADMSSENRFSQLMGTEDPSDDTNHKREQGSPHVYLT